MTLDNSKKDDYHELLRSRMDMWPLRTPKSPDIRKILKELFTEEEAEILSNFKGPFIDMATPLEISQRSGKPVERIIEIFNSLAERGLLFKMGKSRKRAKFLLLPTVIGIFEYTFSNAKIYSDDKLKRLAKLFDNYQNRYLIPTIADSKYPFPRVLPSKTSEKVIEVNEDLGIISQKILPFEEVEELISQYAAFSVMPCSCQTKAKHLGYTNTKPIDVCLSFDMGAEFFIANGIGKRITKEEALDLLIKCEKKGMVHCTLNAQKPDFLCNCDKEHCGILKSAIKFHRLGGLALSNFRAKIEESIKCNECYRCVDICPTHAIYPSIEEGGKFIPELNLDLCIGCGVCSSNCSVNRILLEKVENKIPEPSMIDAYKRYGMERTKNQMT
ncbi:MAG: 4Fe-4S dicluster domain-containing protein [Candidatus Lokiarchaeota archaeon]|nr:4Fe-4S dicluster domain-containing protein [Candidatus Lokiarchaeota archaeon]